MIKNIKLVYIILPILLALSIIISAGIGYAYISPGNIVHILHDNFSALLARIFESFTFTKSNVPDWMQTIIMDQRLPRIVMAVIIGASLSVSGALMQALFHNPLADPFIIGVSSGASFGAAIAFAGIGSAFYLEKFFLQTNSIVIMSSFLGGVLATVLVYVIARKNGKVSVATLLLTGIAIGGIMQSLTTFVMLQQSANDWRAIMIRLMGGLSTVRWEEIYIILPIAVIGVVATLFMTKQLDILSLGDDEAHHLGVNVKSIRVIILVLATLLASISVALCGIIAFVGLIVPHLSRLLIGPKHKPLIICSIMLGAILLIWSDAIARTIISQTEMPIGIITSFVGCIFFLYLLKK